MAGEALFVEQDLRDRASGLNVDRILDDEGTGESTVSAVALVTADASSAVWMYLPDEYELPATNDTTVRAKERPNLRRLALDYAFAELLIRHPEFQRQADGIELKKLAIAAIKEYAAILKGQPVGGGDGEDVIYSAAGRVRSYGRRNEW